MLDRLGLVMLLFGLAGIISAALAGWAVARNGLRPVRRLTTAVEDIARTERLDPIPVEGRDEVARLAVAFNAMLTALSASQARQRQLVADAGHELRTPLTSLRTNLDLLAQADSSAKLSAQSRKELLDDVRGQIAEMTTLIGDLVELARDDPSASPPVEPVELAAVVSQAVTRVRRRRDLGAVRRTHRALVGHRRPGRARAGDHQPARQRRQVEPRGWPGHRRARARARSPSPTRARGSPRTTSRTSSTASTARPSPGHARFRPGTVDREGRRGPARWRGPRRQQHPTVARRSGSTCPARWPRPRSWHERSQFQGPSQGHWQH